ncbi:low molecular weight phosphatase family protein [Hafnia psychrotolerans]|uniref:Protein-tyrosine-phosphatase n=1 Tax=Hafnia psychrotolerans TaxID=1477018 RepID=A0ABQ1GK80_9GAMM|nr:hypothetical protein [Hafnia psychrotolerans]GGA44888.1 hypothetical protein GCM10011328_20030 [Hafnia psychrotolerans]
MTQDVVITVLRNAAGETCPANLAPAGRTHGGVEDPDKTTGSEQEIDAAFEKAWQILHHRIEAFLSLPPSVLSGPEKRLQAELNRIGETIF